MTVWEKLAKGYLNQAIVLYRRAAEDSPPSSDRDRLLREAERLEVAAGSPRTEGAEPKG